MFAARACSHGSVLGLLLAACATPSDPAPAALVQAPPPVATRTSGLPEPREIPAVPVVVAPPVRPAPPPAELRVLVERRLEAGESPALLVADATTVAHARPDDAGAQRLLALVLDESGDPAGALLAYRRAAALEFHAPSLRRQAALEEASGDAAGAVATLELLRLRDPDDVGTHLALAALHESSGRWKDAEAEWSEVLRLRPGVPSSLRRHAAALEKLGRTKDAKAERAAADRLERGAASDRGEDRKLRPLLPSRR